MMDLWDLYFYIYSVFTDLQNVYLARSVDNANTCLASFLEPQRNLITHLAETVKVTNMTPNDSASTTLPKNGRQPRASLKQIDSCAQGRARRRL